MAVSVLSSAKSFNSEVVVCNDVSGELIDDRAWKAQRLQVTRTSSCDVGGERGNGFVVAR